MSQTAIDWLIEQLKDGVKYNPLQKNGYSNAEKNLFEQAKAMEKEQIMDAYCKGDDNIGAEQYYNENYGGKDL